MTRIALLLLLCLLWPREHMAQVSLKGVEITTSEGEIPLAGKFYYLTDMEGTMTARQAEDSLRLGRFRLSEKWILNFGSFAPKVWILFRFQNDTNQEKRLILRLNHSNINILNFYSVDGSRLKKQYVTGDFFPFRQRLVPNRNFLFPVNLAANQQKCYILHVDKFGQYLNIPLQLYPDTVFQQINQTEYWLLGLLLGVLIFVIVYNIFLWTSLKDPVYFAYAVYISTAVFYFLANEGLGMEYIWGDWNRFNSYTKGLAPLAWCTSLIYFTQLFIKQHTRDGLLFQLTQLCKFSMLALTVYLIFHWLLHVPFTLGQMNVWRGFIEVFFPLTIILLVISVLRRGRKGDESALYYLWATGIFWAIVMLQALNRTGILEVPFMYTSILFPLGIIVEIFILSFGLSIRYHQFKRQNDLFQLELARKETELRTGIIRSQDAERARVAADLHDQLGGTIAVVNAKLSQLADVESLWVIRKGVQDILKISAQVGTEVRLIAHNLMPPGLAKSGLLESVSERLQSPWNTKFIVSSFGVERRLMPERELNLYRVIIELVSNIEKHAQASQATIQFLYHSDVLTIIIEDNGLGYKQTQNQEKNSGIGLKSIHSRIEYLNGYMLTDQNVNGTNLIIEIPYNDEVTSPLQDHDRR